MHHDCHDFGARKARKLAAIAAMAGGWGGAGRGPFGGPFGPGFGGGWDGPRRGKARQFGRAELRLMLLRLIADEPRHGYDLIKAMEELSGGRYAPSPGVVYPALAMLADEGLVAEQQSDDQRRKFAVTPAGEAILAGEAEDVERAMSRLRQLGENAERGRAPSIERAAVNLFAAVGQRMADGWGDGDLPHRIAEILDEAARKIERL
jgi:DNA-binding PadR family transcriptional regulator